MYGTGPGGTLIGGAGASTLAYTGTGSLVLPLVLASIAFAIGAALVVRGRLIARREAV
jgi:hypothetical protein